MHNKQLIENRNYYKLIFLKNSLLLNSMSLLK